MYELSEIGKWELVLSEPNNLDNNVLDSQQEAVHMYILPTSYDGNTRILYFAAYYPESEGSIDVIKTRVLRLPNIYDPTITSQIIPNWLRELDLPRLFCCGHTYLQNGKLLCAGGHRETPPPHGHFGLGLRIAYVFDPATETWDYLRNNNEDPELLNDGRWYPTVTNLGPVSANRPYTALVVAGYRYELDGEMPVYNDDVEVFNLGATTEEEFQWIEKATLKIPRMLINTVILPDGKLFVLGGSQTNARQNGITLPELYDPEANNGFGESKLLPCAGTFTRMYHSTGILLLDGSVLVSGGESQEYDTFANGNRNFEIYKPPYLFDGNRPVISVNSTEMVYDTRFYVQSYIQIAEFILIKPCVPTHGFDPDQRAIYLEIIESYANGGITYVIKGPADGFVAPPGKYMLFALRPKSASNSGQNKIPSFGIFINLIANN